MELSVKGSRSVGREIYLSSSWKLQQGSRISFYLLWCPEEDRWAIDRSLNRNVVHTRVVETMGEVIHFVNSLFNAVDSGYYPDQEKQVFQHLYSALVMNSWKRDKNIVADKIIELLEAFGNHPKNIISGLYDLGDLFSTCDLEKVYNLFPKLNKVWLEHTQGQDVFMRTYFARKWCKNAVLRSKNYGALTQEVFEALQPLRMDGTKDSDKRIDGLFKFAIESANLAGVRFLAKTFPIKKLLKKHAAAMRRDPRGYTKFVNGLHREEFARTLEDAII